MATSTASGRALTAAEVAKKLQISTQSVERRKRDGSLPFFKIGRSVRFWETDIEAAFSAPSPAQARRDLLGPDVIAFLSELAALAPTPLTEERKDRIRAAFRDMPPAAGKARAPKATGKTRVPPGPLHGTRPTRRPKRAS